MLLENKLYRYELDKWLETLEDVDRTGWVCGLGHGIHKTTPTANVKYFINEVRERFQ
jgi:uroporphyrinogen decarboxylase